MLPKKLAELNNARVHITFEMFLSIVTARLAAPLSENDLKAAFKLFDRDGSGSVDADEFREVLQNLGDQFTEDEIEEMIKAADTDKSGTIEEPEFLAVMRQKASKLGGDPNRKFLTVLQ